MDTITAPLRSIVEDLHDHAEDKFDESMHHDLKMREHEQFRNDAGDEHDRAKQAAANIAALIGATSNAG